MDNYRKNSAHITLLNKEFNKSLINKENIFANMKTTYTVQLNHNECFQ